jgi:8-oxo-dGTP pyrophosphatase MutT (NUDIX family)
MSELPTEKQVSAGGVVFRKQDGKVEVALISVGKKGRWQLPKGQVDSGETPEETALREVREETGLTSELLQPLDTVEYWYISTYTEDRARIHKYVHFYLMRYQSGDVEQHDNEVNEARWVEIQKALELLAFDNEKNILLGALEAIQSLNNES